MKTVELGCCKVKVEIETTGTQSVLCPSCGGMFVRVPRQADGRIKLKPPTADGRAPTDVIGIIF
jgi:hypothetical protein